MAKGRTPSRRPERTRKGDAVSDVIREALELMAEAHTVWSPIYDQCRAEIAFNLGDQWPAGVTAQRKREKRPCLTVNSMPQFIAQVVNDYRMQPMGLKVYTSHGADDELMLDKTPESEPELMTRAEVLAGMIRDIEYRSNAAMHYERAFQMAVDGGIGWLRVLTDYVGRMAFDQECQIRSIRNRFSVYLDPHCDEPDMSDANYGFVIEYFDEGTFRKRWPKAVGGFDPRGAAPWGAGQRQAVVEYFRREPHKYMIYQMKTGRVLTEDQLPEGQVEAMRASGAILREREVEGWKVVWRRITNFEVLEGPLEFPGSTIPVRPVLGITTETEQGTVFRGLTRMAQDAQRMKNYWLSAATETVALAPKAKFMVTPTMIEGHEPLWRQAHQSDLVYLVYNPDPDMGNQPPMPTQPTVPPVADLQMMLAQTDLIKETIGMYDASIGRQSNEVSGRAIIARQREGDVGAYTFAGNMANTMTSTGQILLEIIPLVYDTERQVTVRRENGRSGKITLNKGVKDENGNVAVVNDLTGGEYDCRVSAGESYSTLRQEAALALFEIIKQVPNVAPYVLDKAIEMQDWPFADEIARRFRHLVPPNALSPSEAKEIPPAQPTPEQEVMALEMKARAAEAEAKMVEAQAKIEEIQILGQGGEQAKELVRGIVAEVITEMRSANQQRSAA